MERLEKTIAEWGLNTNQGNTAKEIYKFFIKNKNEIKEGISEYYKEAHEKHEAFAKTAFKLLTLSGEFDEQLLNLTIAEFLNESGVYNPEESTFEFYEGIFTEILSVVIADEISKIFSKVITDVNVPIELLEQLDEDSLSAIIETFNDEFIVHKFDSLSDSMVFVRDAGWAEMTLQEIANDGEKYATQILEFELENWEEVYQKFSDEIYLSKE